MAANSTFAAGFDEAAFREAIRQTMRMGMPPVEADQLTWHWKRDKTFAPQDSTRSPYDWTQTPVSDEPGNASEPDGELIVDYAIEFSARTAGNVDITLGRIDPSRAVVTLMDEDFEQVRTADYCSIGNTIYDIDFSGPPMGLFAVGVVQVYLFARDEA